MKYVVKPKVGAAHVSYDMRSVAVSVVPRITFSEIPIGTLKAGQTIKLVLFFANPVPTDVTVQLGEAKLQPNEFDGLVPQSTKFTFPTTPFVVSAFDEVEHEDFVQDDSKLNADDDPKIVAYRNLSKVGVFCTLTPVSPSIDVRFALQVNLQAKQKINFEQFSFMAEFNLGRTDDEKSKN